MDNASRRTVLRGAGVTLAMGLAGCLESSLPGSESTPDPRPEQVTFSASVLRQASAEDPARIEVALGNESDAPIELGFKPALYVALNSRVADVRLRPLKDVGDYPETTYEDGCWTMASESISPVTETDYRALDPGAAYTERYDLFTIAGSGDCLPDGSYAITSDVEVRGTRDRLSLTLFFSIGDDDSIEVNDSATVAEVDRRADP